MEKFLINESWEKNAKINKAEYEKLYSNSIENNDKFWNEFGQRIDWKKKYTKIKDVIYSKNKVDIKWFYDGTLNVSENCIDRHAKKNPNKIAIIWEGDDPSVSKEITYGELLSNVNKAAMS